MFFEKYFQPKNEKKSIELKDHVVDERNNVYSMVYINWYESMPGYADYEVDQRIPFMFPFGMSREDGLKILSYLKDYIMDKSKLPENDRKLAELLDKLIDVPGLGFRRVEGAVNHDTKLITVEGLLDIFVKTSLYEEYFKWYQKGVTQEEVKNIYGKLDWNFVDIEDENFANLNKEMRKTIYAYSHYAGTYTLTSAKNIPMLAKKYPTLAYEITYIGPFKGKENVIKLVTATGHVRYYTAIDDKTLAIFCHEDEEWRTTDGNIKLIYERFIRMGIDITSSVYNIHSAKGRVLKKEEK